MPGKRDKIVIWPIYFDSSRSRSQGRMVAAADAMASPSLDDMVAAARKAGLEPEVEREKKHPRKWHENSGRILVSKGGPKTAVLKRIARLLKAKG